MAYYLTGDYYKGDYYRGGRGDVGSFLGGLARGVIRRIAGATPVGMAVSAFLPRQGLPPSPRGQGGLVLPGGTMISPQRILPGGAPFISKQGGACGVSGMHLNKARVYARSAAEKGSYCVKNRHLNPANPRALRRAIRRERGFVVLARRVLKGSGLTISRKGMGRGRKGKRR